MPAHLGPWTAIVSTGLLFVAALSLPLRPAAAADRQRVTLTGSGAAVFASGSLVGTGGCTFDVSAEARGGAAHDPAGAAGSFRCHMSPAALDLGVPFTDLTGTVGSLLLTGEQGGSVVLTGAGIIQEPGGTVAEAPFAATFAAGGAGVGVIGLSLVGVYEGMEGDQSPDDGTYTMAPQTLVEGEVAIQVIPEPSSPPSPTPEPSPTPAPEPTETPTEPPSPPAVDPTGDPAAAIPGSGDARIPATRETSSGEAVPTRTGGGAGAAAPAEPAGGDDFHLRSGSGNTARLMAILAALSPDDEPRLRDILEVVGPFPVAGLAWWQDDWHAPRCCPSPHLHQGLDMFAPRGTPVVAAADGVVSQKGDSPASSGLGIEITDGEGTEYFYAHLDGFAADLDRGDRVSVGEVIGFIGDTGNARGTSTHLHFEVQPGGLPEPPMPFVDEWLRQAESRAAELSAGRMAAGETVDLATWLRRAVEQAGNGYFELSGDHSQQEQPAQQAAAARFDPGPKSAGAVAVASAMFLVFFLSPALGSRPRAIRRIRPSAGGGWNVWGPADRMVRGTGIRA
jgi:hypothetical protein